MCSWCAWRQHIHDCAQDSLTEARGPLCGCACVRFVAFVFLYAWWLLLLAEAYLLSNLSCLVPEWVAYVPQHFSSVFPSTFPWTLTLLFISFIYIYSRIDALLVLDNNSASVLCAVARLLSSDCVGGWSLIGPLVKGIDGLECTRTDGTVACEATKLCSVLLFDRWVRSSYHCDFFVLQGKSKVYLHVLLNADSCKFHN